MLPIGSGHLSGVASLGVVQNVYASQDYVSNVHFSWTYEGEDSDQNIYFLVYLNGRIAQRLPGSLRESNIVVSNFGEHLLEVIPWPIHMTIEQDYYGSINAQRGHLEWSRPTDTDITGYNIYESDTFDGTYTLYAEHRLVSLQQGIFSLGGGGATIEISGGYNNEAGYTNALFTVSVISSGLVEISNDADAEVVTSTFYEDVPFSPIAGIILTISGTPSVLDTASFLIGVQPWYDTDILMIETSYFKVTAIDGVGNESDMPIDYVAITVKTMPDPITEATLEWFYDLGSDIWYPVVYFTGSTHPDLNSYLVYTNYDTSTEAFIEDVIFDAPLFEFDSGTFTDELPLTMEFPNGTLMVVVRAVNSIGEMDQNTDVLTLEIPRQPLDVPAVHSLTATPIAAGGVTLNWLTNEPWSDFYITGGVAPLSPVLDPTEAGIYFSYEVSYTSAEVGLEGEHTFEVSGISVDALSGVSDTVTFITDNTPPATITGVTGTPF